jgi:cysteine synthase A
MKKMIAEDVTQLIGDTPLVRLPQSFTNNKFDVICKYEIFNPGGSIKDRIALAMIEKAEKSGTIKKGATIIEPTAGNTGIGLAMICAIKGYKLILTMPDDMSIERRKILEKFNAEIFLTPAIEGMTGAVYLAKKLSKEKKYFMPQQFENKANPDIHELTTGPEIFNSVSNLDAFICGVGTGGTITGVGRFLKKKNSKIKIIAVEPANSAVLSGKKPGRHLIQGIGASFLPSVLDKKIYNEIITINDNEAVEMSDRLTKEAGFLVGISSGANVAAAIKYGKQSKKKLTLVTILCDTGERYLSLGSSYGS